MTEQRTAKLPYIVNAVCELYKIGVNKVNFVRFMGDDLPNPLPLDPPLLLIYLPPRLPSAFHQKTCSVPSGFGRALQNVMHDEQTDCGKKLLF